jgi:hypothetical protein
LLLERTINLVVVGLLPLRILLLTLLFEPLLFFLICGLCRRSQWQAEE